MSYARVSVPADATDWDVILNVLTNKLLEAWPTSGTMTSPATLTPDHVAIVDTASGPAMVLFSFTINTPPTFGTGVAPQIAAGGMSSTVTTTTGFSVKSARGMFKFFMQNDPSDFASLGSGLRAALTGGNRYLALCVGAPTGGSPAGADVTTVEITYP